MFEHLGKAAAEVPAIEGVEEARIDDYAMGRGKGTDVIFQTTIVDARLAPSCSIDDGKQCSGDIDVAYATLVGGGGEASQIGHYPTAEAYEQAVARGACLLQGVPNMGEGAQNLVFIACGYDDVAVQKTLVKQGVEVRTAHIVCGGVGQQEHAVCRGTAEHGAQSGRGVVGDINVLQLCMNFFYWAQDGKRSLALASVTMAPSTKYTWTGGATRGERRCLRRGRQRCGP